jgi:uncharacterized protein with HEPN domain
MSIEMREKYSEIPWTMMSGIRNRLAHEYFNVDTDIVWNVVKKEFPVLKKQIEKILQRQRSKSKIAAEIAKWHSRIF